MLRKLKIYYSKWYKYIIIFKKNEGKHTISEGSTEGRVQPSPRYCPKKLYAFLSYFVKIGIIFNFYCNKILSFPDNVGNNEGIPSSPDLLG